MSADLRFSWAHRLWFSAAFLFGIAFVFLLPPFQVNDEDQHWFRAWSLFGGSFYCGEIPEVAKELPLQTGFQINIDHQFNHHAKAETIHQALDWRGYNIPHRVVSAACGFFPLGYVPAYLASRAVAFTRGARPRVGGMMRGYYAARLMNWLLVSLGFFVLVWRLPWARNVGLFAYSIPELMQQSVALGLDTHLFFLACLLLVATFGRASWCSVAAVIVGATVMTMAKVVYAPLGALAFPLLSRFRPRAVLTAMAVALAVLLPFIAWKLWIASLPPDPSAGAPSPPWVNAPVQIALLKSQPWHVFPLMFAQLKDTLFGDSLMRGKWTGIFGAFGWSALEMKPIVNYMMLLAISIATVTDLSGDPPPADGETPRRGIWRLAWPATVASVMLVFPLIIVGMFVYFTMPGETRVLGVQGRYYLVPLLILWVIGVWHLGRRRVLPERWREPAARFGPWAGAALCVIANLFALDAIHTFFWT
jgi:hypothetical protein